MNSTEILKDHNLNQTQSRIQILELFLNNQEALSEKEIKTELKNKCDRATIYRTLKTFKETGLIHPIVLEKEMIKYVIKKDPEDHLHFKCLECGKILCFTHIEITGYKLPEGFTKKESSFLVKGICDLCGN